MLRRRLPWGASRGAAPRRRGLRLAALALLLLDPHAAAADCAPDQGTQLPPPGGLVTCTGTDTDGFIRLGVVDDLRVLVQGVVQTAGGSPAIRLSGLSHEVVLDVGGSVIPGISIDGDGAGATVQGGSTPMLSLTGNDAFFDQTLGTVTSLGLVGDRSVFTLAGGLVDIAGIRGDDVRVEMTGGELGVLDVQGLRPFFAMRDGLLAEASGVGGDDAVVVVEGGAVADLSVDGARASATVSGGLVGTLRLGGAQASLTVEGGVFRDAVRLGGPDALLENRALLGAGVLVDGAGSRVENDGQILGGGSGSFGVLLFASGSRLLNRGLVATSGVGSDAVAGSFPGARVDNHGTIRTGGASSAAVALEGPGVQVVNRAGARIETLQVGSEAVGILGDGAVVRNDGAIETSGFASSGIDVEGARVGLANDGDVTTHGDQSPGIGIQGDAAVVDHDGDVSTSGAFSFGIGVIGQGARISSQGIQDDTLVSTTGQGAAGIGVIGDDATVTVSAPFQVHRLQTTGDAAAGVFVAGNRASVGLTGVNAGAEIRTLGDDAPGIDVVGDQTRGVRVGSDGLQTSGARSPGVSVTGHGGSVEVFSAVLTRGADSPGIRLQGDGLTLRNAAAPGTSLRASIRTEGDDAPGVAVGMTGAPIAGGSFTNLGAVHTEGARAHGVAVHGDDFQVQVGEGFGAQGSIVATGAGSDGVRLVGDGNRLQVFKGLVEAQGAGAAVRLDTPVDALLANQASIFGGIVRGSEAIVGSAGAERVFVGGTVEGRVDLLDGADAYALFDGVQAGAVDLGAGDDTFELTLSSGRPALTGGVQGGSGRDLLRAELRGLDATLDGDAFVGFEEFVLENSLLGRLEGTLSVDVATVVDSLLNVPAGAVLDAGTRVRVQGGGAFSGFIGDGVIRGSLIEVVQAALDPRGNSPGRLVLDGDLVLDDAVHDIEIAGTAPGAFDVLEVLGDVSVLDATVALSFTSGFRPRQGDTFAFLEAAGLQGLPSLAIAAPGLPAGFQFELVASSGGLALATRAVSEPALAALLGAGGLALSRRLRSRPSGSARSGAGASPGRSRRPRGSRRARSSRS
jgi:hypothetical protein